MTLDATDLTSFGEGDLFDAEAAFESTFKAPDEDLKEPKEKPAEGSSTDAPAGNTGEGEGASGEPSEGNDDDLEVELPVGTEQKKFKVKDLLKLHEEQSAITSRSAEIEAQKVKVAEEAARYQVGLQKMLARAQEKWEPWSKVDWLVLQQQYANDPDTFAAMRQMAQEALTEVQYFKETLDNDVKQTREQQMKLAREAAVAAQKELEDPEKGIKGFGPQLYEELMKYGESQGLPGIRSVTNAAAIRVLHDAMMYRKGLQNAAKQVEKVVNKPTRVLKPSQGQRPNTEDGLKKAMNKLQKDNSVDAAADAFMASFKQAA